MMIRLHQKVQCGFTGAVYTAKSCIYSKKLHVIMKIVFINHRY